MEVANVAEAPICALESKSPVNFREQRTQEELKAIEALEELSRLKSVDIPLPTIVQEDLVSEPEINIQITSGPSGGDQPDGQPTLLDSDVEIPPESHGPSSLHPVSQGN